MLVSPVVMYLDWEVKGREGCFFYEYVREMLR
jgi:hypothetical protein